ncbi:MAG TPA: DEAD/DEAH box helicase [Candidatus Eisenbacteria bacterium]|jgi:ATP-dependent RNA helicase RhlE
MTFSSLGLPDPITRGVRAAGYTEPTPIQRSAIPLVLPGHDVVAAAQTGSGKTAAFLLPILARLLRGPRALRALILVPTRELAAQVADCARDYARFTGVRSDAVFGGVPIAPQERLLRNHGVELLVATPGRLLDLHGRRSVSLDEIEVLVLDEADRMVDMGFAPDLRRILALLPRRRQTLMFSATMPPELNTVAREALRDPRRVAVSPPLRPAAAIAQAFYPVPRHLKVDLLDRILTRADDPSALVFARTRHGADRLARQLKRLGHAVTVMHGDRSQGQRERALGDFRRGRIAVLVATDIASRGIDVDDISHVINFDVPRTPEDYIHRIGRTGRMNAAGDAFTLVSPEEHKEVAAIERSLGCAVPRVTLSGFNYGRSGEGRGADRASSAPGRARRTRPRGSREPRPTVAKVAPPRGAAPASGSSLHGRRPRRNLPDRRSRRRM